MEKLAKLGIQYYPEYTENVAYDIHSETYAVLIEKAFNNKMMETFKESRQTFHLDISWKREMRREPSLSLKQRQFPVEQELWISRRLNARKITFSGSMNCQLHS